MGYRSASGRAAPADAWACARCRRTRARARVASATHPSCAWWVRACRQPAAEGVALRGSAHGVARGGVSFAVAACAAVAGGRAALATRLRAARCSETLAPALLQLVCARGRLCFGGTLIARTASGVEPTKHRMQTSAASQNIRKRGNAERGRTGAGRARGGGTSLPPSCTMCPSVCSSCHACARACIAWNAHSCSCTGALVLPRFMSFCGGPNCGERCACASAAARHCALSRGAHAAPCGTGGDRNADGGGAW